MRQWEIEHLDGRHEPALSTERLVELAKTGGAPGSARVREQGTDAWYPIDDFVFVSGPGGVVGPVSLSLVQRGVAAGKIPPDALFQRITGDRWEPVAALNGNDKPIVTDADALAPTGATRSAAQTPAHPPWRGVLLRALLYGSLGAFVGAALSQFAPIFSDVLTRAACQPFSPCRQSALPSYLVGGVFVGGLVGAIAGLALQRASVVPRPELPQVPAAPAPGSRTATSGPPEPAPGPREPPTLSVEGAPAALPRRRTLLFAALCGAIVAWIGLVGWFLISRKGDDAESASRAFAPAIPRTADAVPAFGQPAATAASHDPLYIPCLHRTLTELQAEMPNEVGAWQRVSCEGVELSVARESFLIRGLPVRDLAARAPSHVARVLPNLPDPYESKAVNCEDIVRTTGDEMTPECVRLSKAGDIAAARACFKVEKAALRGAFESCFRMGGLRCASWRVSGRSFSTLASENGQSSLRATQGGGSDAFDGTIAFEFGAKAGCSTDGAWRPAPWPAAAPSNSTSTPPAPAAPTEAGASASDGTDAKHPALPAEDEGLVDRRGGWEWSDRCWLHLRAEKWGWAKAECDRGLALPAASPQPRASLLYNEGLIARAAGDVAAARRFFQESLAVREHPEVRAALAALPDP
jgi:hypothetical protein